MLVLKHLGFQANGSLSMRHKTCESGMFPLTDGDCTNTHVWINYKQHLIYVPVIKATGIRI